MQTEIRLNTITQHHKEKWWQENNLTQSQTLIKEEGIQETEGSKKWNKKKEIGKVGFKRETK